MTRNASFIRKIVYISLMALLLLPLSYLSQPAGVDARKHPGGKLDRLRQKYDLSQSSLGEVDPTSETMKLATLGMRGVATTVLWQKAHEHKMKENWDAFAAVLRQISKLQPHFIQVWIFQSWNQSYNVSVEFDDYHYRYRWVKKGIDYLVEGTRYNQRDVRLQWQLGWVFGHKIGRSDEKRQFRQLFQDDTDFHKSLPIDYNDPNVEVRRLYDGKIDNWLVGREFFLRAIRIAKSPKGSKHWGQSPLLFYSEPAMQRMKYAEAILEDGYYGEHAGDAWRQSGLEWTAYGNLEIPTSTRGISIRLNDLEKVQARIAELQKEFDRLTSALDVREELRQEKMEQLDDAQRAALAVPAEECNDEQKGLAAEAEKKLKVTNQEIADRADPQVKKEAVRRYAQLKDLQARAAYISSYRNIVNFEYWATRCAAEQQSTMIEARRDMHEAAKLYEKGLLISYEQPIYDSETGKPKVDPETGKTEMKSLPGAKEVYERGFKGFAKVFEQYPVMLDNPETEDLLDDVKDYRDLLVQLDQELPEAFELQIILEIFDTIGQRRPNSAALARQWAARRALQRRRAAGDPRAVLPRPPVPPAAEPEQPDDPRAAQPRPPVPPSA